MPPPSATSSAPTSGASSRPRSSAATPTTAPSTTTRSSGATSPRGLWPRQGRRPHRPTGLRRRPLHGWPHGPRRRHRPTARRPRPRHAWRRVRPRRPRRRIAHRPRRRLRTGVEAATPALARASPSRRKRGSGSAGPKRAAPSGGGERQRAWGLQEARVRLRRPEAGGPPACKPAGARRRLTVRRDGQPPASAPRGVASECEPGG